jgi:hypothetical protein
MIPIDPDKPFEFTSEDGNFKYYFRYITYDIEEKYNAIVDLMKKGGQTSEENSTSRYVHELINFLLVGWEGEGFPAFPTDKNPARYFIGNRKIELFNTICKLTPSLLGITIDEVKN